jgi:hypothetical protein
MGILARRLGIRCCLFGSRACKFLLSPGRVVVSRLRVLTKSRLVCFAVALLNVGHPGPAFRGRGQQLRDVDGAGRSGLAPRMHLFVQLRSRQASQV